MATHTITITSNQTLAAAIAASGIPADTTQNAKFVIFARSGVGADNAGTGGGGGECAVWDSLPITDPSTISFVFNTGSGLTTEVVFPGGSLCLAYNGFDGAGGGAGGFGADDSDFPPDSFFHGGAGGAGNGVVGGGGGGAATENHAGNDGNSATGVTGGPGGLDGDEVDKGGDGGGVGQVGQNATNGGGGAGAATKAGGTGTAGKVRVTYIVLESGRSTRMSLTGVGG